MYGIKLITISCLETASSNWASLETSRVIGVAFGWPLQRAWDLEIVLQANLQFRDYLMKLYIILHLFNNPVSWAYYLYIKNKKK